MGASLYEYVSTLHGRNKYGACIKVPVMVLHNRRVHAERCCKVENCCNRFMWLDSICFGSAVRNGIGYSTVPYPLSDFSKFVGSGTLACCPPGCCFFIPVTIRCCTLYLVIGTLLKFFNEIKSIWWYQ